jgi:hypothetical protein
MEHVERAAHSTGQVRAIYADGDTVVAGWDGVTTYELPRTNQGSTSSYRRRRSMSATR